MSIDRMLNFLGDHFGYCMLVFLVFLSVLLLTASNYELKERTRLISQCMSDGKKEYECVALFEKHKTVVMPVVTR